MAARRRDHKTKDLPPNLYCRGGYYSYRDPRTGKEYGLGRDKRFAVNESVAANMEMMPAKVSLVDKINGKETIYFSTLIEAYRDSLKSKKHSPQTSTRIRNRLKFIESKLSDVPTDLLDVKCIHDFIAEKNNEGKSAIANQYRSILIDIFNCGISRGLCASNPASLTKPFKYEIDKSRLTFEEYLSIMESAKKLKPWVSLCFDLAVLTGQRESDLAKMLWSDIDDGRLKVCQSKTKAMIKIPLDLSIKKINLNLGDVLENLKAINGKSDKILGGKTAKVLAEQFRKARDISGLTWEKSPPPFHELRSIAGRLYEEERGIEFAARLLAHKDLKMTQRYTDARGREWVDI